MVATAQKKAAILAIGDELLSGRTRDANIHHLGNWLTERGVALCEARIVADDEAAIVSALNALRHAYDYVFTSGGIGPTHDDITVDAVAAAFELPVIENPEALSILENWYAEREQEVTDARRRMARTPEGASLINNPVSGAPGVIIGNVFVMAGVPRIFKSMLENLEQHIEMGAITHSAAVTARGMAESQLASHLVAIQDELPGLSIGSYPMDEEKGGVTIVARSFSQDDVTAAIERVAQEIERQGIVPEFGDRKG